MRPDTTQLSSDSAALLLTVVAVAVFLTAGPRMLATLRSHVSAAERVFTLTLQAAQPVAPAPRPPPVRHRSEKHPSDPRPAVTRSEPVPLPQSAPETPLVAAAEEPPAVAPPAPSRADLESAYAAQLRADIDRRKHPPDSAQYRLRHPSGEVRVRFVVLRSGQPEAASIARSSGSVILDQEALQLVSSGHYPPMPPNAFVGEAEHTFLVTVEFPPARVARDNVRSESAAA